MISYAACRRAVLRAERRARINQAADEFSVILERIAAGDRSVSCGGLTLTPAAAAKFLAGEMSEEELRHYVEWLHAALGWPPPHPAVRYRRQASRSGTRPGWIMQAPRRLRPRSIVRLALVNPHALRHRLCAQSRKPSTLRRDDACIPVAARRRVIAACPRIGPPTFPRRVKYSPMGGRRLRR